MDPMFSRILNQALQLEGSEQALATRLHVPGSTLSRWLTGRAQTPLGVFLITLQFIMQRERAAAMQKDATQPADAPQDKLVFPLGELTARCACCNATEFRARDRGKLRLTSVLRCAQCGTEVVHGELLAQLARKAVQHTRAAATRTRLASQRSGERAKHGDGSKLGDEAQNQPHGPTRA